MICKISVVNGKKLLVPLEMDWKGPSQTINCSVSRHSAEYSIVTTAYGSGFKLQTKDVCKFVK